MPPESETPVPKLPKWKTVPQMPDTLAKKIQEFPEQFITKFGKNSFKELTDLVTTFDHGNTPDDYCIFPPLMKINDFDREYQVKAYIKYMSLTLYWYKNKEMDAAWLYYSKAQYYLGIYDSWKLVSDQLAHKSVKNSYRAKGGKAKSQAATQPLMDALISVIIKDKPPDGWKNKRQLFNKAKPVLDEIYNNLKDTKLPKHENLENNVLRWLKTHKEILPLYAEHSAPGNFDCYP